MLCLPALALTGGTQQQTPTFRAGTDLILIDTRVVGRDGTPITGLKPEQFEVFLDGRRRPVVSAEFARAGAPVAGGAAPADGASAASDPQILVLAVDEGSFPSTTRASAREAATRVLDKVAADIYVGMIAFPSGREVAPTQDRAALRAGIAQLSGVRADAIQTRFNISATEATLLKARVSNAVKDIVERECRQFPPDPNCQEQLLHEGRAIVDSLEFQGMRSISGLHGVLDAVAPLPGRKTLVVISAGLPLANRPDARLNMDAETVRISRRAAAVNINLYVFYMNVHFLRYFSPEYGRRNNTIFEDINLFATGLEKFADTGGGSFAQVEVNADPFVDRMMREISASYLVGIRTEPADHDGKEHAVRITVKQGGSTLRYRRFVTIPAAGR